MGFKIGTSRKANVSFTALAAFLAVALFAGTHLGNVYADDTADTSDQQAVVLHDAANNEGKWVTKNGDTYYQLDNGSYLKGYQEINGDKYYFGRHSGKLFNDGWHTDPWNGKEIFLSPKNGVIARNQWVKYKGYTYHTDNDGYKLVGYQKVNGEKYYFGRHSGKLFNDGWHKDPWNGKEIFLSPKDGSVPCNKWVDFNKNTYHTDKDGYKQVGYQKIDGNKYYFGRYSGKLFADGWHADPWNDKMVYLDPSNKGAMYVNCEKTIEGKKFKFDRDGYCTSGSWVKGTNGATYYKKFGKLAKGYQVIDGDKYYFGRHSGKLFNDGWHTDPWNGKEIFLSPKDGSIPCNKWVDYNGATYHTDKDGYKQVGYQRIDGNKYYLGRYSGKLFADGWHADPWNDKMVYLDPSNKGAMYVNCEKTIDGKSFKFDKNGYCTTGVWVTEGGNTYYKQFGKSFKGYQTIDGKKYYFGRHSGKLFKDGWHTDPWNGKEIFLSPKDGSIPGNSWVNFNGDTYRTDKNGYKLVGYQKIDGNKYYLGRYSGKLFADGWHADPWNGKMVYLDPNNKGAMAIDCEKMIEGKPFKFDKDGYCTTGRWVKIEGYSYYRQFGRYAKGYHTIDGKKYYFGINSGRLYQDGWHKDPNNGKFVFLSPKDGSIPQNAWVKYNNATYHTDKDGYKQYGYQNIDGKRYYLGIHSGKLFADGWHKDPNNGKLVYLDPSDNGAIRTNQWFTLNGKKYYADEKGYRASGITKIGNKTFFFKDNGDLFKGDSSNRGWGEYKDNIWFKVDYLNDNHMLTGKITDNGKTYNLGSNGLIKFGWLTDKNGTYCEDPINGRVTNAWKKYDGSWIYLDKEGYLAKGLKNIDGKTYYFGSKTGKLFKNGWHWIPSASRWAFLNPKDGVHGGAAYTGTHTINGNSYTFDKNGLKTKGSIPHYEQKVISGHSKTHYQVIVDKPTFKVYVYTDFGGYWKLHNWWWIGIGKYSHNAATPAGEFEISNKTLHFGEVRGFTCWYATDYKVCADGSQLAFHTAPCYPYTKTFRNPGYHADYGMYKGYHTHGCIRVNWAGAKYIYDNVPRYTRVYIFSDGHDYNKDLY